MKTLYLHIGTPKTATTAIQSFCWENQEILESQGYYYPKLSYRFENVQKYRNGHFLVCRVLTKDRKRQPDKQHAVVVQGMGRLHELFETHDNLVLSDEGIWNRGFFEDTHCWREIKKELVDKGIVVKVIVYFRRQDDFMFSWWSQQVKEGMLGSSVMSWEEVIEKMPYIKLDYYGVLSDIAEYVGRENIIVRIFDRSQFVGGTIQQDFLDAIGAEYTEEYQMTTPMQNPSLTKNCTEIKRIMNNMPELEVYQNNYFRKVVTNMSGFSMEDRSTNMFSEEEYHQFMERYREGNAKIVKEFLGREGDLFDYTYHAQGKWSMDNEQMFADMIQFFGTTTLHLMNENAMLKAKLADLKEDLNVQKQHIRNIRYKMKHPAKTAVQMIKKAGSKAEE